MLLLRTAAIVAMLSLAVPMLAAAQEPHPGHPPPGRPGGGPPHGPPHGPPAGPHPGPGPRPGFAGPHPGPGPHGQFTWRGRPFNRVHSAPFIYPPGWGYRRWVAGAILAPLFLAPAYYYSDWATMGLAPPPEGYQWVRYGPDLLLVNIATGQVADVIYGAFY
jgi:Nickel/cobalt transporter regulator